MGAPHANTWIRLTLAALEYARVPAEDDRAFMRARDRLRKAAVAYRDELAQEREAETLARLKAGMAALDAAMDGAA